MLNAKQILDFDDLMTEVVDVPEWNGSVTVREMRGFERDAWERTFVDAKGKSSAANMQNMRATLLVRCLVNEEGERLFTDKQADALGRKGSRALSRLFDVAARLNGITKTDQEELAEGNDSGGEAGGTSSTN